MQQDGTATEATILVKAALHTAKRDEEIIYCAGVTPQGDWVRLAPVHFRKKSDDKQFKRWDRVKFRAGAMADDARPESRRVVGNSLEIVRETSLEERKTLLRQLETDSLTQAQAEGKTLALLNPKQPHFTVRRKDANELAAEKERFALAMPQTRVKPFPYRFQYTFGTEEGSREAVYQDWEMNETFSNLSKSFGEPQTVAKIIQLYGRELPGRGVRFVMSRDAAASAWAIHAVICMDEVEMHVGSLDLVV